MRKHTMFFFGIAIHAPWTKCCSNFSTRNLTWAQCHESMAPLCSEGLETSPRLEAVGPSKAHYFYCMQGLA